jgi:Tol biopolymer transport system component
MINKTLWQLNILLIGVFLSFYSVSGASISLSTEPDIIFVRIPAAAKPGSLSPLTKLPLDRYVDGCQIVGFSMSYPEKTALLTAEFLSAQDPAISFDGQTILFAGKKRKEDTWQIWQMDTNGGNKIQITHENTDCASPLYVGSIFHLDDKAPTRKIAFQEGNHLYTCNLDGKNPQRITYNLYPEFDPDVLPNGRIIFSSIKNNGIKQNLDLLAVNIDGTDLMGYLTSLETPGNKEMVRVAQDKRIYFIQSILSEWLGGGSLAFVSSRRPTHTYNLLDPNEKGFYHSPCPLPDGSLIVSYRSQQKESIYNLYLLEPDNKKTSLRKDPPLVTGDNKYHCVNARVVAPHPIVKGRSSFVDHNLDFGTFYCIDVYISDRPKVNQLTYGAIKQVRVLEGISPEGEPVLSTRILGTAPVETDGSFHIRVPAKTPLAFQLLDKMGKIVVSQHSWTWVMPRESRGCIGCHEDKELAPPNQLPIAITKPAINLSHKLEMHKKKGDQ